MCYTFISYTTTMETLQKQKDAINDYFKKLIDLWILKIEYETEKDYRWEEKLRPNVSVKYFTERQPKIEKDYKYKMICSWHTDPKIIMMHLSSTLQNLLRDYYMLNLEKDVYYTDTRLMNRK